MAERLKLTVTQVKDVQKVGEKQKEKLTFLARGEDGKEKSYSTMRTSLFDAIRNNKEIEADVEVTETGTYINRYVSEVYVDGKAVGAVKGQSGRQWGGKSPEEIASIETQVAVKAVVDLLIAGKIATDSPLVAGMEAWIGTKLGFDAKVNLVVKEHKPPDSVEEAKEEPRGEKERLQAFKDECERYGWDVNTKTGADTVKGWLVEHFLMGWKELTAEAQEVAISRMRQKANEKGEK